MPGVKRPKRERRRAYFREWRKYRRMTLEQVAAMIEYDHSNIQRLEMGKIPYNQDIVERLAEVYRCEPTDLISRDPLAENVVGDGTSQDAIKAQVVAVLADLLKGIR